MRLTITMIVMLGLPAVAAAQPAARVPASGSVVQLPPIGLPLPQIGLPLPQIGLPLPPIGLPPAAAPERRSGVNHPVPGMRRQHPSVVYLVPTYGWPSYQAPTASAKTASPNGASTPAEPQRLAGYLRLDIEPNGAQQQLYVDSSYVGTFTDFSGELELDAGPHIIEIRALGYETLRIDVNISSGHSITYRGSLKATEPKPATEAVVPSSVSNTPVTPMIVYTVPGCYIGNVPPPEAGLRPGCDAGQVITSQR